MEAQAIVAQARARNVMLRAEGSRIIPRPAANLTDDLRHAIRDNKAELLAYLPRRHRIPIPPGHVLSAAAAGGGSYLVDRGTLRSVVRMLAVMQDLLGQHEVSCMDVEA